MCRGFRCSETNRAPTWLIIISFAAAGLGQMQSAAGQVIDMTNDAHAMQAPAGAERKILYYRNPMGLPDVSPTPKKDSMGMDYIPVYEGAAPQDAASVLLTPGRIQRSGVRTEVAEARVLVVPVRGFGLVQYPENAVYSVTVGIEGTIDEIYVHHVGESVHAGQPLFRMWANNPQQLQLEIARRSRGNADQDISVQAALTGAGRATTTNRSDWPSPASGIIIAKRVVTGQRVNSTDELLRIADPSKMWVIVDIPERDAGSVKPGQRAILSAQSASMAPIEGTVLFVFPDIKSETRTARICIEVPNPDGRLKAEMYLDVTIRTGADRDPAVSVSEQAVIDNGARRHVLIDQGEGHFSVREVQTGIQGQGYVEILSGVTEGETVVTSANFLIDSEANISAALAAFSAAAKKQ